MTFVSNATAWSYSSNSSYCIIYPVVIEERPDVQKVRDFTMRLFTTADVDGVGRNRLSNG